MQDEIDAIRFAAEQGDVKAQSNLGLMYDQGLGVPQNYAEAVRWFQLAAEQGDAGAQCQLGAMYATGKGVSRDQVQAHMWLSLAAAAMKPSEHRDFAVRFRDKVAAGLSVEDLALAQELARNWNRYNIDAIHLDVIRAAAEQGHPRMQCFLGSRYAAGRDVPRDYAEAAKWFRLAAEQDDVEAQSVLGLMYQEGKGVPQDHAEAVRWLRLAAEQGHAKAQGFLGSMYAFGKGVPEDYREAAKWYRRAADQGDADAQYNLGTMYATGQGLPQDNAEAARWFRLAAEQGDANAERNLMYLEGRYDIPQGNAEAAVPTETTQPETSLGKWLGIGISILIGVALITATIAQL